MTEKAGLVASPHQPMPKPGTTEAAVAPPRGRRPRRCSGERKIMAAFFSLSLDRRFLSTTAAPPRGRRPRRCSGEGKIYCRFPICPSKWRSRCSNVVGVAPPLWRSSTAELRGGEKSIAVDFSSRASYYTPKKLERQSRVGF
jgi:hypothetical protein